MLLGTLSGRATLEHLEEQFGAAVSLKNGVGEMEVFVRENVSAELRIGAVEVDRAGLALEWTRDRFRAGRYAAT